MRTGSRTLLIAFALLATLAAPVNALEIFGNTGLGNAGRQFGTDSLQYTQLAQGFTMGSTSYQLSSVVLGLNFGNPVPNSSQILVSLFDDNGSNLPGTQIGTFNTGSPNPAFAADGRSEYTFNYSGTTTLTAGSKYWVVVQNIPTSPVFDWWYASGNPSDDPSAKNSSGVTYLGTRGTLNGDGSSWSRNLAATGSNIRYTVNVVPEPSTYALGLAGTLVLGTIARRRNRLAVTA
jgi:hypothetical protein